MIKGNLTFWNNKLLILGLQQSEWEVQRSHRPLSPLIHGLPRYQHPPLEWYSRWHIIITRSRLSTSGLTLDVVHSVDLDKCIITRIHHYGITHKLWYQKLNAVGNDLQMLAKPSFNPVRRCARSVLSLLFPVSHTKCYFHLEASDSRCLF